MLKTETKTFHTVYVETVEAFITNEFGRNYSLREAEDIWDGVMYVSVDERPLHEPEIEDINAWVAGEYDSPPALHNLLAFLRDQGKVLIGDYLIEV